MKEAQPVERGSRWVLDDGRRVQVTSAPYWLHDRDYKIAFFVENRRQGCPRTGQMSASSFARRATPVTVDGAA
jgi:hypothetical protein